MHYERLSAADTAFLRIETPREPQHVGSLSILEGGPLRDDDGRIRFDELRDHVDRRLSRVPRLRQRLMEVPYGQGRPVWVDDADFDISYHVRLTSLPRPGDDEQLRELMSRLQSLPLDRTRPLWEMWFVDGLEDDEVGLILKTHHALGDGIANVDLALALVDLEPDAVDDGDEPRWYPRRAPSPNQLLTDTIRENVSRPGRVARSGVDALRNPRPAIDAAIGVGRTAAEFLFRPQPAPWNKPVTAHRRWVHADVDFATMQKVRKHHDVSINDVVLAACTGALRTFLANQGEPVNREMKAMVPVSLRRDDEHGDTLGNRISLVLIELPIEESDPLERLARINERTTQVKGSNLVDATDLIIKMADSITPLATPLTRFVSRRIPMNLVITNIPGPPMRLYLRGARIERTYPYVEVIDIEGMTIAVVSYCERMYFGLTADRDVVPELGDLAASIEAAFAELAHAAKAQAKSEKKAKKHGPEAAAS